MDFVSGINDTINNWCDKFSEIADKYASIKIRRAKCTNESFWITTELTEMNGMNDIIFKSKHIKQTWNTIANNFEN